MKIIIGADHRGFEKKEKLKEFLEYEGYEVTDVGAVRLDPEDDYVDVGVALAEEIDNEFFGVLLCGSGHGMDMTANRFAGVRAILGFNVEVVKQGREHEDANVLVIAADWVKDEDVVEMVKVFLMTERSDEERHVRRRQKLMEIGR